MEHGIKALARTSVVLSLALPGLGAAQMTVQTTNRTLIEFIEAIPKPLPASAAQIEDSLGVPLRVMAEDRYWARYESKPITTVDNYVITKVDLRMATHANLLAAPESGSMLVLWIDSSVCVPPGPIKEAFGMKRPGRPAMDDPSSFSLASPVTWGKFSITIRSTSGGAECVDGVVIDDSRQHRG
jgi:hypothetical protein